MTKLIVARRRIVVPLILGSFILLGASSSYGHGGLGHMQVTAWAVENLPQGEFRAFLANRDVYNSILFGAAYPDIGYYPGLRYPEIARKFAEYSHWPPFMEQFIEWIRVNDPPPWNTLESRMRVAFLLGCAAHGFQDEVFDTLFLPQVRHHDDAGQPEADPASDGLLVRDALITDIPTEAVPVETLIHLYNTSGEFDTEIDEEIMLSSIQAMSSLYIHEEAGPALATIAWEHLSDQLPWMEGHYMDADIPGSLKSEIFPTARYLEAIWKRLHNELTDEDMLIFSFPEIPRRLRSHQMGTPDSWVSFLFAAGINPSPLTSDWKDANNSNVAFSQDGHAWGGSWHRIIRLIPGQNLDPGGHYTTTVQGDVTTVNEKVWSLSHSLTFQVACDEGNPEECPDLEEFPKARLDGAADFKAEWTDPFEESVAKKESSGCAGCSGVSLEGPALLLLGTLSWFFRRRRQR